MLVAFLLPVVLQARTTRTNSDSATPKDLIVGTLSEIVSSSHLAHVGSVFVRVGLCDFVDRPVFFWANGTIHEITQTKHETRYHRNVFKAKLPTKKERDSRLRSVTEFAEKVSTLIQIHI